MFKLLETGSVNITTTVALPEPVAIMVNIPHATVQSPVQ